MNEMKWFHAEDELRKDAALYSGDTAADTILACQTGSRVNEPCRACLSRVAHVPCQFAMFPARKPCAQSIQPGFQTAVLNERALISTLYTAHLAHNH